MVPHEISIGGVYFPPLLLAAAIGIAAALVTGSLLNRYRLSRYFTNPPLVMVSLMIIYTTVVGSTILPG